MIDLLTGGQHDQVFDDQGDGLWHLLKMVVVPLFKQKCSKQTCFTNMFDMEFILSQ